jgi:diadenylate cyclase
MEIIGNIFAGIFDYVKLIRPSDILDILIIAFLIYKVLTFLARTGSARVFRGIVLLIGMLWLSNLLDLYVVSFIFGKTFELGILALLILFQPEVRQILERVGSSKFTKLVTKPDIAKNMDIAINQVIQACLDMARTRTGALIIFEREISLADYIKTVRS